MNSHGKQRLSVWKRLLLPTLSIITVAAPVVIGAAKVQGFQAPSPGLVAKNPTFEVASIKQTDQPFAGDPPSSPNRFIRRSTTVVQLIGYAYDLLDFQVQDAPGWAQNTRFAVEATAADRPSAEQMRLMVRRLLAERFGLKAHLETAELPRYALVTARDDARLGDKLRPSATDCPALIAARGPDYTPPPLDPKALGRLPERGAAPRCAPTARMAGGSVTVVYEGTPMSAFARTLQPRVGRVVIDKTGLAGTYDIELETEAARPPGLSVQAGQPAAPREGLSLFTALQEQLGLKLESDRGPVDVLVINSVERPTPD